MKTPSPATLGRFAGLILVTLAAGAVMLATATRSHRPSSTSGLAAAADAMEAVAAPVVVRELKPEPVEVLDVYSGMIHPFERYSVGFETAGRVQQLGTNADGQSLDEGDLVAEGQTLAQLDHRLHQARLEEMTAILERAQQELERARKLRNGSSRAISEAEFQQRITDLAVAQAQVAQAQKSFDDTTLQAPCDGVISKRLVNAGESIAMHQPVMEIVQVNRLLLIVGVPESRVQELANRRRQLHDRADNGSATAAAARADNGAFRVHVQLMGADRFGRPWPPRDGEVYRISETADDKTGLFEVEVLLNNSDRQLKPGQIAVAKIVLDELTAFRLPVHSVLFRGKAPYLYAVTEERSDLNMLFWNLGPDRDFRAVQVPLEGFIEQEGELILPTLDPAHRRVVLRGQHRLVDGRRVRIVQWESPGTTASAQATSTREGVGSSGLVPESSSESPTSDKSLSPAGDTTPPVSEASRFGTPSLTAGRSFEEHEHPGDARR